MWRRGNMHRKFFAAGILLTFLLSIIPGINASQYHYGPNSSDIIFWFNNNVLYEGGGSIIYPGVAVADWSPYKHIYGKSDPSSWIADFDQTSLKKCDGKVLRLNAQSVFFNNSASPPKYENTQYIYFDDNSGSEYALSLYNMHSIRITGWVHAELQGYWDSVKEVTLYPDYYIMSKVGNSGIYNQLNGYEIKINSKESDYDPGAFVFNVYINDDFLSQPSISVVFDPTYVTDFYDRPLYFEAYYYFFDAYYWYGLKLYEEYFTGPPLNIVRMKEILNQPNDQAHENTPFPSSSPLYIGKSSRLFITDPFKGYLDQILICKTRSRETIHETTYSIENSLLAYNFENYLPDYYNLMSILGFIPKYCSYPIYPTDTTYIYDCSNRHSITAYIEPPPNFQPVWTRTNPSYPVGIGYINGCDGDFCARLIGEGIYIRIPKYDGPYQSPLSHFECPTISKPNNFQGESSVDISCMFNFDAILTQNDLFSCVDNTRTYYRLYTTTNSMNFNFRMKGYVYDVTNDVYLGKDVYITLSFAYPFTIDTWYNYHLKIFYDGDGYIFIELELFDDTGSIGYLINEYAEWGSTPPPRTGIHIDETNLNNNPYYILGGHGNSVINDNFEGYLDDFYFRGITIQA